MCNVSGFFSYFADHRASKPAIGGPLELRDAIFPVGAHCAPESGGALAVVGHYGLHRVVRNASTTVYGEHCTAKR